MSANREPIPPLGQTAKSTILAIILGAQEWPNMKSLRASNSFKLSYLAFKDYLVSESGLNLPSSCVEDLFDEKLGRDDTDIAIRTFLEKHYVEGVPNFTDLIIYYTGHGDFTRGEQHFQVILRSSNDQVLDYAGYTMRQLAATVNSAARKARKLVILDCCYAAAAFDDWQKQGVDDVKRAITQQAAVNFPDTSEISGTALLCACDEDKWALFKDNEPTMFTGGLVQSLLKGDDERGDSLSIGDVYTLTKEAIGNLHHTDAVTPVLHVPKGQREQLTSYALFPNPARRFGPLSRRLSLIESKIDELTSAQAGMVSDIKSSRSAVDEFRKDLDARTLEISSLSARLDGALQQLESRGSATRRSLGLRIPDDVWKSCPIYIRETYLRWRQGKINGLILGGFSAANLAAAVIPWTLSFIELAPNWAHFIGRVGYISGICVVAFATAVGLGVLHLILRNVMRPPRPAVGEGPSSGEEIWELDPLLIHVQNDEPFEWFGFLPVSRRAIFVSVGLTMVAAIVASQEFLRPMAALQMPTQAGPSQNK
jgi:hypothetical protein